ncbi:hypothetical protein V6Z11_D01G261700 [Gossypium hirsutum]
MKCEQESEGLSSLAGGNPHIVFKGGPHNPLLFSNEASEND